MSVNVSSLVKPSTVILSRLDNLLEVELWKEIITFVLLCTDKRHLWRTTLQVKETTFSETLKY